MKGVKMTKKRTKTLLLTMLTLTFVLVLGYFAYEANGISITTKTQIQFGSNGIVVEKDNSGNVKSVKSLDGTKAATGKPVTDLKLVRKGQKGKSVISISDNAVIVTHSSPDCITYIYNGQEYEICF
jgi:hypothetical protein